MFFLRQDFGTIIGAHAWGLDLPLSGAQVALLAVLFRCSSLIFLTKKQSPLSAPLWLVNGVGRDGWSELLCIWLEMHDFSGIETHGALGGGGIFLRPHYSDKRIKKCPRCQIT